MNDSELAAVIRELRTRHLLAPSPDPLPLTVGNVDRRDGSRRVSLRARGADGSDIRLLVAPALDELARRQRLLAAACPGLVPAPCFHEKVGDLEAFADRFIIGDPLDTVAARDPARAVAAVTEAAALLAATSRSSSEPARAAEWADWSDALLRLELWSDSERAHLRADLLPRLYRALARSSPQRRWSNGDFFSANLLVDAAGHPHLIDAEFAQETHFSDEDAVRFHAFSPCARADPARFAAALPPAGPAWHLFFWLRQVLLECTQNTPAYLARFRSVRLAVIRRLAEFVLDVSLPHWSAPALEVSHALELVRGEESGTPSLHFAGWAHRPGSTIARFACFQEQQLLATTAPVDRPDVRDHFAGDPAALASGFNLIAPLQSDSSAVVLAAFLSDGTLAPLARFVPREIPGRGPWLADYASWAALYDPDPAAPKAGDAGPDFSVLLPVFNTPPAFLTEAITSVRRQSYHRWELVVSDDGSTAPGTLAALAGLGRDGRIRIIRREKNGGIARATNDALAQARGDFVLLLDHDDLLRPHALAEFAAAFTQHPEWDAAYSDEDKIAADGTRVLPLLKPDFSPEFLLGVMYVGHALCVRTTLARDVGGFDPAFDGVQDFEFLLRVAARTRHIGHLPRILYHWRQSPASSALQGNVKGDMDSLQLRAVRSHLARLHRADEPTVHGGHRIRLRATSAPHPTVIRDSGMDPLMAFREDKSAAPIVVWVSPEVVGIDEESIREIAAVAALPDSGLAGPLLLSAEGWVFAAGETRAGIPIMRGYDPAGDGYHGSLPCRREVARLSNHCFAIKRELLAGQTARPWADFCTDLQRRGLFHRVCPEARAHLRRSWRDESPAAPGDGEPDPFFNPHFDRARADYSLARPPPHLAQPLWHLDTPLEETLRHGSLILRGWVFDPAGGSLAGIRLRADCFAIPGVTGLPRPDVANRFLEARDGDCGFEIRGVLPPGPHRVVLEVARSTGEWHVLETDSVVVRRPFPPLWLGGGSWQELMFFQMPGHAKHAPRPVVPDRLPARSSRGSPPNLAIVTPSYQHAQYLPATLASVLSQAHVAVAYVVQDGGSTDGSAEIIRGHAPQLAALEIAPDHGQADAIAKGFAKTSGGPDDLMAWINSDDFYLPGALAFVADFFARHPDVDVIYGHRVVVDEAGREIARWFLPRHDPEVLRLNDFVPQETLFWRRRIWDRIGGIDPSFKFAMDWDLLLRMQAAGARIVRVPYFLACFRVHPAQKTSAQMHSVGQREIERLRERTFGRPVPPAEIESHPRLLRYLRRSAFTEFLWCRLGIRAP